MKKLTNLIILDASGSMNYLKNDVVKGIHEVLDKIKKDIKDYGNEAEINTIIVSFSDPREVEVILNTFTGDTLESFEPESYNPGGSTALFDAIGFSFKLLPKEQDGVFISIITDGYENSSRLFTQDDAATLIKKAKEKDWLVMYQGVDGADIEQGKSLSVADEYNQHYGSGTAALGMTMTTLTGTRSEYTKQKLQRDKNV